MNYLDNINLPIISNGQKQICDTIIVKKEICDAYKSMENDKTRGNDRLSKEFYKVFWDDVIIPLLASINDFIKEELSTSQKQAVIKLIGKKDRDKRFIKNLEPIEPISLLNTDLKLITKALATRLKDILSDLISTNQTAYVEKRYKS